MPKVEGHLGNRGLCAARYRPNEPRAVLREAAALAIEGHPRTGTGAVTAPLPAHALAVLNRLFVSDVPLAEFQRELADTHAQQPEVTPAARAAHLGLQTVLLAVPLAVLFVLTFTLSVWLALGAEAKANAARRAAAVLADPAERAKFAQTGDRALDRELEAAVSNPRAQVRAADAAARATAEAETRAASLLLLQQRIAANTRDTATNAESGEAARRLMVREFVLWAGERTAGGHDDPFRSSAAAVQVLVLFAVVLAGMVLSAALTRGGVSMLLAGVAVVRGDGRPASRRQCAGRAVIVWGPVAGLLLGSALLQVYAPGLPYLAAGLFLLAAGLLPAYAVLALRYPARPPHDRFVGTFLVPG
ncbi:MAG: hypothetical protein FJ304_15615 [Planctomycetes bacterium]|nr:hypothetical protein [Planctomycetota bacterium]